MTLGIQEPNLPLAQKQAPIKSPPGLPEPPVTQRPTGTSSRLSFAQQQVWLHAQLAPGVPLYNEVLILERIGPFHREALERSFREVMRRHETLRANFPATDGTPAQTTIEHQP